MQITGGTLRLNVASGNMPTVGAGVTATVASGATLELAGPVSALTDATTNVQRVDISDAGTVVADSGAVQQVGGIDGSGTVQSNASSSLTANHITAGSLVIGGDATHSAIVAIAASDSSGNPMTTTGFALAGSLAAGNAFGGDTISSSSLLGAGDGANAAAIALGGESFGSESLGSGSLGGVAAVPEPSSLLLIVLGLLGGLAGVRRGRKGKR